MTTTDFTELHADLRAVAVDVLDRSRVVDWSTVVHAGWVGLEVPDSLGGAGATFTETALICQELGRAAASTHFLGSAVLAVGVLNATADSEVRDGLLADVAAGRTRVASVVGESFSLDAQGRLTGHADFVPDAHGADRLLVVATDPIGADVVALVETAAVGGLAVSARPVLDQTRHLAAVSANGIDIADAAVLHFAERAQSVVNRAAVALACDSLGLAEAMLEATVSYARTREQFGRPIGSFQAVKHACADMLVKITVARALVRDAVLALTTPGAEEEAQDAAVSMAKSYTCAATVDIVGAALQLHGGIGYTWESGIHVYLKRATFNRSLFGSPAAHRRRIAARY